MKTLFDGIKRFREEYYKKHEQLYAELHDSQSPHSLFITCSDSRVLPEIITSSIPGELFIIRNIANMVPIYHNSEDYLSVPSGVEYAVEILNVQNIIICGHSNCGGIASMMNPKINLEELKFTAKWLELGKTVKNKANELHISDQSQNIYETAEKLNVIEQMEHLKTYPFVSDRLKSNKLKIYGWYYKIDTGEIYNYDKAKNTFELID
ncbi:MAG: carbonic anhydrase [Saprospiraceae bacterium]